MNYTIQNLKALHTVKYIIHIADVHIRLQKRQDEYKEVFENLYASIEKFINVQTDSNTIIYLAGDIVHTKTDNSPEQNDMLQEFLRKLCTLAPVIMITGNHDCNLNNRTRLDALAPVVNALHHPNLFYLKDSGIYNYGNITFTVMSVFDKPSTYIKSEEVPGNNIKIALHHGAVNGSKTAIGFEIDNNNVTLETFKGYDLTLLGDIHQFQYLDDNRRIAYASSLIQQDHGETLDHHGYLVWNLDTFDSTFVEVPNPWGYVTLHVKHGIIQEMPVFWPQKTRLRFKLEDTSNLELQILLEHIKNYTSIESISKQKVKDKNSDKEISLSKIEIQDVRDIEVQNRLISEYLQSKYDNISKSVLDGVRHINRLTNAKVVTTDLPRYVTYRLKLFEFDNVFSYGPGNKIDFSSMSGIHGLFAHNRSGKSSILDALLFCIFDKCSKTSIASFVLNNKSDQFRLVLHFELNHVNYVIERTGIKNEKNGHVRVKVNFYSIDEHGEKQILNGKERDDTNKIIKRYLGEYEDFILTTISSQNSSTGFIEMTQKQRKEILSQFLDISRFEELYEIASRDIKDVASTLKVYQKQNFVEVINSKTLLLEKLNTRYNDAQADLNTLSNNVHKLQSKLLDLNGQLNPTVPSEFNEDSILDEIELIDKSLEVYKVKSVQLLKEYDSVKQRLKEDKDALDIFDHSYIERLLDERKTYENAKKSLEDTKKSLAILLKESYKKLEKLKDLTYDENCVHCMNNVFVKDAIATKESIHIQEQSIVDVDDKIDTQISLISSNEGLVLKQAYDHAKSKYDSTNLEHARLNIQIEQLKNLVSSKLNERATLQNALELGRKHKEIIEKNNLLHKQIEITKGELSNEQLKLKNKQVEVTNIYSEIQVNTNDKSTAEVNLIKMQELENEYSYYEMYLNAVKRDGVPYNIICQVLPQIEHEINNVLSQLVDFTIVLQTDDKNIDAYIVYDDDNSWPIELISGMEKFVSSLAIRTALINITSLPKPNFVAIDEGFTQLDAENINSVYMLFSYLKTQFDFIIIISHLEILRDMVDKFIDVRKDHSGFSKVEVL